MISSTKQQESTAGESTQEMGNSCVKKSSVPCFRVVPKQQTQTQQQEQDKVAYCLPWEKAKPQSPIKVPHPCCFCWCCLCTCACKYNTNDCRRPISGNEFTSSIIEIDSALAAEKCSQLTADRLNQWKSDFDSLINDEAGKMLFHEFLRKEYSDENLMFWIDVERMKEVQDGAKRYLTIRKIYKEYIQPRAQREVNVEAWVRKAIEANLEVPSPNIFDPAQTQVYLLMYRQSWPRFLDSKYYNRLISQTLANNSNDNS